MRGLVALLSAVCVAAIAALLLGFAAGHLTPGLAWASLMCGVGAGVGVWISAGKGEPPIPPAGWTEWSMVILFALISLRAFLWVVYADHGELKVLLSDNIGDLPKHWNYAQYLANGSTFWPENPHLAGTGIHYPIGVDLFSSLLRLCGLDMIRTVVWTGLAGAAAAGIALFLWGRAFTVAGFLFNGGFFGIALLFLEPGPEIEEAVVWKNLFLALFVTQRGFLYALPAGLLLLVSWRRRLQRFTRDLTDVGDPLPLWIEVLLYSTMPLFHLHTFLFLSWLLGCWFLFSRSEMRRHILKLGLISLLPAVALTLLVTDGLRGSSTIRWQPGWMQHEWPFLYFWLGNFGLFLPFLAALSVVLGRGLFGFWGCPQSEDAEARHFVWPAALVFGLCGFFVFAPWEWDNTKLLIWAYLVPLPFLWSIFIRPLHVWLRGSVCVLLFFSGFIALFKGVAPRDGTRVIAHLAELDSMVRPFEKIPIAARIAAAAVHDHPLMFLGRKMAMAYPGHLFGHGFAYQQPQKQLDTLMRGEPDWEVAARDLQANYILWGSRETALYGAGPQAWRDHAGPVVSGKWGTLFVLEQSQ